MNGILNGLSYKKSVLSGLDEECKGYLTEFDFNFNGHSINRIVNYGYGSPVDNDNPVRMYAKEVWTKEDVLRMTTKRIKEGLVAIKTKCVLRWLDRMNGIPSEAVTYLAQDGCQVLAGEDESAYGDWLVSWGTMWTFKEIIDKDWAQDNSKAFEEAGFSLYDVKRLGLVFGVDGGGYDFVEEHFLPLYDARGIQWHEPWPELEYALKELDKEENQ